MTVTDGPQQLLRRAAGRLDLLSAGTDRPEVRGSLYRAFAKTTAAQLFLYEGTLSETARIIDLALVELNGALGANPMESATVTQARLARRELVEARRLVKAGRVRR